jgi:twitching motility protein PilT
MARLDGFAPIQEEQMEGMLNSIMPPRNKQEYADLNDTDFAYEIEGLARFRCNALRDRKGAGAVFRSIPSSVVSVEQLGLSQEVQNLCYMSKGLVLVTGPTGSGKSTTLGAMMDLINRVRPDHVITIEDPIEFVHHNKRCMITQRQVGQHTQSFKAELRAALREDPDIILVGELRDLETVSIAIETAETGHLVFGTLHTTTAASTVDRIIDQFPADRQEQIRVMLSESLKGVIAQTLCRKIGGGRVAAREILLSIPAIANLIREGKTFQIPSVIQTSRKLGMVTLNDALFELVDSRQVEPREAYIKAHDKSGLVLMFKNRGLDVGFAEAEDVPGGGGAPPPKGVPRAEFKGPTAPPPVASRPRK